MTPHIQLPASAVAEYALYQKNAPEACQFEAELSKRVMFFRSWTRDRLATATRDDMVALFSQLWSMAMWGNKASQVDQIISDNGLEVLRSALANLLWGEIALAVRWDEFRATIKRVGPAMMSELLAHTHPEDCLPWTSVTQAVYFTLGVPETPKYSHQIDGHTYEYLCAKARDIAKALQAGSVQAATPMEVNYFIWWFHKHSPDAVETPAIPAGPEPVIAPASNQAAEFLHNEVRDKLADIGRWLGLRSQTEVKVAAGAIVDTIWEVTVGNMGRVIYVFEVQTKGSIDSLVLNLLRSLNNPAVQGVVAVSDEAQLAKVKEEVSSVPGLNGKLKLWNYTEVLKVHASLESVNSTINALGLVPEGF